MDKLKMHSPNITQQNIEKLLALFPNCKTEKQDDNGKLSTGVDFDLLKQELSNHIVEGPQERYQLNWPGKKEALLTANAPIAKTLRPCREESVDFDTTENLFIEGDNLDALKLLQETYLGKVKMIYIDPPYNTGKDFIYADNFAVSTDEYLQESGQKNDKGDKLVANTESNGRFHSDWLSMMYSRLKLAKNLLKDDGVIFISIDDGELNNAKKLCDEVLGLENFRNTILTRRRVKSLNAQFANNGLFSMNIGFEYILVYSKTAKFLMQALQMKKKNASTKGKWDVFWSGADRPTMRYDVLGFIPVTGQWRTSKEKADIAIENYQKYLVEFQNSMSLEEYAEKSGIKKFIRRIPNGLGKNGGVQHWVAPSSTSLRTTNWTDLEVSQINKEIDLPFDNPKSKMLLLELTKLANLKENDISLDFFAGSATTAHAVMQLNAEDNSNRKFIMVQLPEICDKKSEAFRAGYSTIAEISKERIRLAGKKVKEENPEATNLDTGFRVLKIDSSNMNEVHYTPDSVSKGDLFNQVEHIKTGRSSEDLLFQVMLDWGVDLSLPICKETIEGKEVYFVNDDDLVACFEKNIDEALIKTLATKQPLRVVFRDDGFGSGNDSDSVKINVEQIFKQLAPATDIKVI